MAFETLHYLQKYNSRTHDFMAMKLDMNKAYDRVEWTFLEEIMTKMGFNDRWINLMMVCVKLVTYSILVNGELCGMIQPTKGIRQGDPLPSFSCYVLKD